MYVTKLCRNQAVQVYSKLESVAKRTCRLFPAVLGLFQGAGWFGLSGYNSNL